MRGGTSLLHRLLNAHPRIRLMAFELRALRYADLATWTHAAAVHQSSLITRARWFDTGFRRAVYRYLVSILRGHGLNELTTIDRIHDALAFALADGDTRHVGDKVSGLCAVISDVYPPPAHALRVRVPRWPRCRGFRYSSSTDA